MVKIKDVATHAQVSSATVSRVLNGNVAVSEESRLRVLESVRTLGYRPNRLARNLRRRTTETIGVVVSDIENPHFAQAVRAIENIAYGQGYRVLLCNTDETVEKQRDYLEVLASEQVRGVILACADAGDRTIGQLIDSGIPVVAFDRAVDDPRADTVTADNHEGARLAVEHLTALGHRRIGFVGGRPEIQTGHDRLTGYREAMATAGLPPVETNGAFRTSDAERASMDLLAAHPDLTALIVANNLMTIGTLRAAVAAGRHVPDDLALVGFDDPLWAEWIDPALTAVAQPVRQLAGVAIDLLLERMTGARTEPTAVMLPFQLIVRRSSGVRRTVSDDQVVTTR